MGAPHFQLNGLDWRLAAVSTVSRRRRAPKPAIVTNMNSAGQPIQKMPFGRIPKPWVSFNLETGELVTADRIHVGKPAPGKFVAPVEVWVTPKG